MALSNTANMVHLRGLVAQSLAVPTAQQSTLYLNHIPCGWVDVAVAKRLSDVFPTVKCQTGVCYIDASSRESMDMLLAQIALYLKQAGCLPYWRDECLDILDLTGQVQAQVERGVMRVFGALTQAIHLTAWTPDNRLWVAQRAWHKPTNPGKWDTLAGGLVASDESYRICAIRESWEEAGVPDAMLTSMQTIGVYTVKHQLPEGYQRERSEVFDVVLPESYCPQNRDGEAIAIESWTVPQVMDALVADAFTKEAALAIYLALGSRGFLCQQVIQEILAPLVKA